MKTQKEQKQDEKLMMKLTFATPKECYEVGIKQGRTQAISEFKKKLIKRIAPDRLHRKWNEDVLEIIEKTAQEIRNG